MLMLQADINVRFRKMLNLLLIDLIRCWQRPSRELLNCEAAFLLTKHHCSDLQTAVFAFGFCNDAEEIHFFRFLLPQFAGRLLYYSILYEALHSCPPDRDAALVFWDKEANRLTRFRERNILLVEYLEHGSADLDTHYFLSRNRQPSVQPSLYENIFRWDDSCSANGSTIAAALVAENFYFDYACGRLLG